MTLPPRPIGHRRKKAIPAHSKQQCLADRVAEIERKNIQINSHGSNRSGGVFSASFIQEIGSSGSSVEYEYRITEDINVDDVPCA
jgi:hypothetical protein